MQQINLNRQKLIALVIAALALIFMFLTWYKPTDAMGGALRIGRALGTDPTADPDPRNGFHGWGFLSLAGIVGVVILSLIGDKTRPFEGQIKQSVLVSFADISIGAIISLIDLGKDYSSGVGLYLCMVSGIAGVILAGQLLKTINFGASATTQTIPTLPIPPPPPPPK